MTRFAEPRGDVADDAGYPDAADYAGDVRGAAGDVRGDAGEDAGGGREDVLRRSARRLFYLGCLTMPLLLLRPGGGLTFSDLLFLLSLLVGAPSILATRRSPVPALHVAVVATFIAVLVSLPTSRDQAVSVFNGFKLVFVFGVWVWQARALLDSPERFRRAATLYCAGAAFSSLAAVAEIAGGLRVTGSYVVSGRASGLASHPNDQGALLAAAFVICVGFAILMGRRSMAVLAAIIAAGLIVSGSLSGMAGAIAGLVVLAFRTGMVRRYGPRLLAVCLVGLAGAFALLANVGNFENPLQRLTSASSDGPNGSVNQRLDTLQAAFKIIPRHPLTGVGLDERSSTVFSYYEPHNAVVLAALQGGVALVIALLAVYAPLVRLFFGRIRNLEVGISLGVAIAMFVYAMTAPVSYQRYAWLGVLLCYVALDLPATGPVDADTDA